jgi:seryl-tRNA synthetase
VIDLKLLRASPGQVRAALARRGDAALTKLLDELEALDMRRRALAGQLDQLNAERNDAAKADARVMKEQGALPAGVRDARRKLGERGDALAAQLREVETTVETKLLYVPNLPLPDVPDGDETHNTVVRTWGEAAPKGGKPHWEIGEQLGILDLARGAKLSGSGFPVFVGVGARLVRALINFMLDLHTREHGYVEVEPPFVVRRETMVGTGQLPKFEDDAYRTTPDDLFLVPTAEVPVTNLHRDEILDGASLPRGYVSYTPCFRREAGAAGKDTRGLLRVHQFDKVELVRFCRPADSPAEHERLTGHAEEVLRRLELPYRVVLMAIGDLGFAAAKKYDLEVWAPGVGKWLEVSSSSTFTDFQARRANIRYRPTPSAKPEFVHTLNASGVALPRTIAALLETLQRPDGSVAVPAALAPYLDSDRLAPAAPAAPTATPAPPASAGGA